MGLKMLKIGQGYDVHRFKDGGDVILGGVKIPYERGWFTIAYAAVGFLFSLAYLTTFLRK